jgi:transcriptional regulator with XRE-family HTH domain
MSSLPNYLRTHRNRAALSQEEVAFLLGLKGMEKGSKVSRDEQLARTPNLETALAYAAIYDVPVKELFAGMYEEIEQAVAQRAKLLGFRIRTKPNAERIEVIARLVSKLAA